MQPEGLVLDPAGLYGAAINLGNFGTLRLAQDSFDPGIAKKRPEWATSGDSDGGLLVREPLYDNADGTFKVRVRATSMDAAISAIGTLEQKLQECEKQSAGGGSGLPALWTPAGASIGLTMYLLLAEITDRPITVADGWLLAAPILTIAITRKPFLYGSEVTGPTASGGLPNLTVAVPSVPGDVAAEARLVLTDTASQARRFVEWGLEQLYYNAGSPSSMLIDSEDLVTTGFAGVQATRTGGYRRSGATHDVVSATLLGQSAALCGTGSLPHVGSFRVKARVWAASTGQYWRLNYQTSDGPLDANAWAQPVVAGDFNELDLGVVTIGPAETGTQSWQGIIEAYTTTSGGEIGQLDYLKLYPVEEGYGRIEAFTPSTAPVISAYDALTSGALGTALNARVATVGGSWATSGAATDFTQEENFTELEDAAWRGTASDSGFRFAILGSSGTDTQVDASIFDGAPGGNYAGLNLDNVLIARWASSSNHLRLRLNVTGARGAPSPATLVLEQVVSGTVTTLATAPAVANALDIPYSLRLIIYATGHAIGLLRDSGGNTLASIAASSASLATGGALASGQCGFADRNSSALTPDRFVGSFAVSIPPTEQLAMNASKALEIRSNANLRQPASGSAYADLPSRGARLLLPAAGAASRATRIVAGADPNDPTVSPHVLPGALSLAVFYTPRYLAVPRS